MSHSAISALEIAISAEIAAADLYQRLAQIARNPESQGIFFALATDERRHREILEERYLRLAGRPYAAKPVSPIPLPPASDKMLWPAALTLAIKAEIEAYDRYTKAAAEAADPEGQAMYRQLAEDEAGHRRLLEAEYAARLGHPFSEYELAVWVRE